MYSHSAWQSKPMLYSLYPPLLLHSYCPYYIVTISVYSRSCSPALLHSARFLILSTSRGALSPTCPYQSLSTISSAALLQLQSFTAAMSFLKLLNPFFPKLNIILAMILCASWGRVSKLGKTALQFSRAVLTSCVKSSSTLSSVTLVPTGFPYSGSLRRMRWPMPTVRYPFTGSGYISVRYPSSLFSSSLSAVTLTVILCDEGRWGLCKRVAMHLLTGCIVT